MFNQVNATDRELGLGEFALRPNLSAARGTWAKKPEDDFAESTLQSVEGLGDEYSGETVTDGRNLSP